MCHDFVLNTHNVVQIRTVSFPPTRLPQEQNQSESEWQKGEREKENCWWTAPAELDQRDDKYAEDLWKLILNMNWLLKMNIKLITCRITYRC